MVDVVTSIRERIEDLCTRLEMGFKQPHDTIELAGLLRELVVHLEETQQETAASDEPENGPAAPSDEPEQAETQQEASA